MTNFDVNLDTCVRKTINLGKLCPKHHHGEHCDECAESDRLYQLGKKNKNEEFIDDAKTLFARSKVFVNAVNVKDEDPTFPVYIYIFPPRVYDDLMGMMRGQRQLDPSFNAFHPVTGRNILMTRKGSGKMTRYTPMMDTNVTPLCNEALLEKLKAGDFSDLHDLNKVEEFIAAGYLHMRQFEGGTNIIRLLPPFDGLTVYKELKFHRFTVAQFKAYKNRETENTGTIDVSSNTSSTPPINDEKPSDPFDPFDLPQNVTDRSANPITKQENTNETVQEPTQNTSATTSNDDKPLEVKADADILDQIAQLTK
jgi:hypothetical protein